MKDFQKQLLPILEDRFRGNSSEVKRHLKEASTPAAQTLITYIRQWGFQSRNIALGRLLETDRWNDDGELVLERNFKGKAYPMRIPLAMAWDWFVYGDQKTEFIPNYSFADSVKKIPANAKETWLEQIQKLFYDINHRSIEEFKIIVFGRTVKSYSLGNPYTYIWYNTQVKEFIAAQTAINEFVMGRKGWEYIQTENLQNPNHKTEMSKVLQDILAKADERVEPAQKQWNESERKMYIRQEATQARNDIKTLTSFFKKYGVTEPSALKMLANIINDVESQALNA